MKVSTLFSILALFIFSSNAFSQKDETFLTVKGLVTEKGQISENSEVKAFDGNDLIWSSVTQKDGTFELRIPENMYVSLVIEKNGFMPKYVIFDTRSIRMPSNLRPFVCNIDLIRASDLKGVDVSRLDFPAAIIEYDRSTKGFKHNEVYNKRLREEFNNLLNNASVIPERNKRETTIHENE